MIKKSIILLTVAVGFLSCGSERLASEKESTSGTLAEETAGAAIVESIEGQQAKGLLEERKGLIILDVRTQKEYDAGHVKDALHIDFYSPKFSQHLLALDPDKTYMVYCAVGGRSKKAVDMMAEMGFKQLYEVSEGYAGLKDAGVPVVANQK